MDIDMPEMNGLEATTQIRKENMEIPIIAVTAFSTKKDIDSCFKAGMNGHSIFLIGVKKNISCETV